MFTFNDVPCFGKLHLITFDHFPSLVGIHRLQEFIALPGRMLLASSAISVLSVPVPGVTDWDSNVSSVVGFWFTVIKHLY